MAIKEAYQVARKQAVNWPIHIRYGLLIGSILVGWGVRETHRIAPKVEEKFNQIAGLNKLENVNLKIGFGGCSIPIKGNL